MSDSPKDDKKGLNPRAKSIALGAGIGLIFGAALSTAGIGLVLGAGAGYVYDLVSKK